MINTTSCSLSQCAVDGRHHTSLHRWHAAFVGIAQHIEQSLHRQPDDVVVAAALATGERHLLVMQTMNCQQDLCE